MWRWYVLYSLLHIKGGRSYVSDYPSRRISALFGEHDDNNDMDNGKDKRHRASLIHQQRRRKRRRRYIMHQESHKTAAGVESLFSLRSLFSTYAYTQKRQTPYADHRDDGSTVEDLPSIDCEWACNSEDEQVQLQQMKLLLKSEMQSVVDEDLHTTYPDVYSDLRLLRFLRKSKVRDVISSAERYRSFLEWRKLNNVDTIRAMVEESDTPSSFVPLDSRLQSVSTYFPMKFDYVVGSEDNDKNKRNKNFQPVSILYIGSFDTTGISEEIKSTQSTISVDTFLKYWIYLYESIHFHLYQQSIHTGEMIFLDEVCDLSGLSIQQFSAYFVTKVMKPWLKMTQSYYPETTRRIYVLNPPSIVNLAWKLVTPLLSQGTVDKIRLEKKFNGSADEFCNL